MTTNTTPEHERRYFQNIKDGWVTAPVSPPVVAAFASDPHYREVLIAPIPEIEVDEPDNDGRRWAHIDGGEKRLIDPSDTAADWRETRDFYLSRAGDFEAIARWIEANHQPAPESVARVQAVRDALDWNYDRDPMLTAMFRDCAETAVCAVCAVLGITVSDEPETPDDAIERAARAEAERRQEYGGEGIDWDVEVEAFVLGAQWLAAAGLLRAEPDERAATAERIAQAIEAVLSLSPRRSLTAAGLLRAARIAREVGEAGR